MKCQSVMQSFSLAFMLRHRHNEAAAFRLWITPDVRWSDTSNPLPKRQNGEQPHNRHDLRRWIVALIREMRKLRSVECGAGASPANGIDR